MHNDAVENSFAAVHTHWRQGNRDAALARWQGISELTSLLFAEPSPAPAKYWLARTGLIVCAEVRLPMVDVSAALAARLDTEIAKRTMASTHAAQGFRASRSLHPPG